MNVQVTHPGEQSLGTIAEAIDNRETIWRSPHVGNVNAAELSLMLGISQMGGSMQIELVDTIRGDDKYSDPRSIITRDGTTPLASRKYAKSRVVGACEIDETAMSAVESSGWASATLGDMTLRTFHVDTLRQVMPDSVVISPSSEFYASLGQYTYSLVIQESAKLIDRPIRMIDQEGKIREGDPTDTTSLYGLGTDKNTGLLPPLEAMMAIEVIKKVQETNGADGRIVHVAGPDMIRYTRMDEIMQPVTEIARRVLGSLGVSTNVQVEYVVPCMRQVIESSGFPKVLEAGVVSQYDILQQESERRGAA